MIADDAIYAFLPTIVSVKHKIKSTSLLEPLFTKLLHLVHSLFAPTFLLQLLNHTVLFDKFFTTLIDSS